MSKINNKKSIVSILAIMLTAIFIFTACGTKQTSSEPQEGSKPQAESKAPAKDKPTIIFADAGWDSIRFHNDVAGFIIKEGYGYKIDEIAGSTPATFAGFRKGDINVYTEVWVDNIQEAYDEAIKNGEIEEVSVNFDDDMQGLYVPTYAIEGDPERGIEPMAPDLKTVKDLEKYPELFKDPEDPGKGRIYGSPPGWAVDEIMQAKIKTYGLDKTFNYFSPGSDTALAASIASAVAKGDPWVGYYWDPTWVTGKYDLTLLADDKYSKEKWDNGYACEFPSVIVTVAVNTELNESAPDIVEFLKNYTTSSKLTGEALAYMQDNKVDTDEAAKWFLKEKEDLWTKWVSADVAQKVKDALK